VTGNAQQYNLVVHYANGLKDYYPVDAVDSVSFSYGTINSTHDFRTNNEFALQCISFSRGVINNNGGFDFESNKGIVSDFLRVDNHDLLLYKSKTFFVNKIAWYDENKRIIAIQNEHSLSNINTKDFSVEIPVNANYARIELLYETSHNLNRNYREIYPWLYGTEVTLLSFYKQEITLTQWNVGHFNYGKTPAGIKSEIDLQCLKEGILNNISDIFICNECDMYYDQPQSKSTAELFGTIYPYNYFCTIKDSRNTHPAVFSKYPIKQTSLNILPYGNRYYIDMIISVNGYELTVVIVHLTPGSTFNERLKDMVYLCNRYNNTENVIISGDFNLTGGNISGDQLKEQLRPWVENGFNMANMGFHGEWQTSIYNYIYSRTDNTFTKCSIDYVIPDKNAYVSDHFPYKLKLTFNVLR
jgi:endonuclease/exonuclease/phosphatase family metal-dependent hydrolase